MAVVKTPSGRWRGKVKQGRLTLKTKTFNTRREAAAWVERQKAILDGGVDLKAGKQTLGYYLPEYLEQRRYQVAQTTYNTDVINANKITPWLKGRSISEISPLEIEQSFIALTKTGLKWTSVKRYRDSLRAVFAWAMRQGLVKNNPVSTAQLPRRTDPPHEMRPWSIEEVNERYEIWHQLNPTNAKIAKFLALTGLRWSEARALRVGDVSYVPYPAVTVQRAQPEGVDLKTTKSNKTRLVPLANELIPWIKTLQQDKKPADALLPPMHRHRFVDSLDWYNTAQGRTIHDLRHTAICIWLAAGIDLATVRAWAGHADLTTTSRYTHWLGTKADQTSLATLNQAIKNTTSPSPVTNINAVNGGTHGVREI